MHNFYFKVMKKRLFLFKYIDCVLVINEGLFCEKWKNLYLFLERVTIQDFKNLVTSLLSSGLISVNKLYNSEMRNTTYKKYVDI